MRTFEYVNGMGVVPNGTPTRLARVADKAHSLDLLARTSLDARDIVERYLDKGLSGTALDRAVARHARLIRACDPDVVSGIPSEVR